jgi:hypothetical protein
VVRHVCIGGIAGIPKSSEGWRRKVEGFFWRV